MDLNYWAIIVAAVVVFILSGIWYTVFGRQLAELHPAYADPGPPSAPDFIVEVARNLVLATVVAALSDLIGVDGWTESALLGLVLWIGFPVILLAGSVYHEKVPSRLALIHAGDWLLKLILIAIIVGVWQ